VRRAQIWLAGLNYLNPDADSGQRTDGVFGGNTEDAVIKFQKDAGLPENVLRYPPDKDPPDRRSFDETTWNTLQKEYYDKTKINDDKIQVKFASPFKGEMNITSEFGKRDAPTGGTTYHKGIDLTEKNGGKHPDVMASIKGTVVFVGKDIAARGNTVAIQSSEDKRVFVVLQHLDDFADLRPEDEIKIKIGDKVASDTVIGTMGGTGKDPPFSSHLHYEITVSDTSPVNIGNNSVSNKEAINPWILFPPQ
jgi:murein DD-endopeptidase MepM/ murein hydrolase activator NlpD